jgi:hypothetical protein
VKPHRLAVDFIGRGGSQGCMKYARLDSNNQYYVK